MINPRGVLFGWLSGVVFVTSGCIAEALNQNTQLGGAKDTVGTKTESQLVKCAQPLGTAALVEPEKSAHVLPGMSHLGLPGLSQAGLPSPIPLLKLMMSRSNCFQVVDRGRASEAMKRERELMMQGELREGSNLGAGQMVAADYLLTPDVVFQDTNAGGGGFGGLLGMLGPLGLLASAVKTENLEAQTVLTLTDVRTGLQKGVAEGNARKRDISFGLGGLGGFGTLGIGAVGGAYASTDVGKIVSAALLDAFNKLVASAQGGY